MTIRAILLDIGGVILLFDQAQYERDAQHGPVIPDFKRYERLNEAFVHFVRQLRPYYQTATICNGGSREALNRKFRLNELVDLMVFDEEEGISKPDARIYQRTLLRLEVQAEEAIFVDDKECNVEAARQLGLHAIHFRDTEQAISSIQALLSLST
ncbi:putative hydrolase of the HAD superfamily [Thermosporothrix hazakensis]|jgi:putative hydrolase of the HAD superfamily|uniref:Haloacid dehalogenase n=2 Tax=Thermosporothrix TaxID=768650 RepID=A0A455SHX0_9CHLR|nr:HAD-IA family hydrolase [Thermosporothrix hazakensis]PZW28037.1 putative hydrolase of the HAD superfamily [Thermosporothrix hazakensis]BBH86968.1 hypothetical protein KTC_17190 [Thermosporothrix sp. COM3]GCE51259.1 hypothetical protein KTH_61280 [Thermosporothrix hazakensis]